MYVQKIRTDFRTASIRDFFRPDENLKDKSVLYSSYRFTKQKNQLLFLLDSLADLFLSRSPLLL